MPQRERRETTAAAPAVVVIVEEEEEGFLCSPSTSIIISFPPPLSPLPTSTSTSRAEAEKGGTILHAAVKWLRSPQGAPSGVCTGQRKPHDSGLSLRTAVVLSCEK